MSDATTDWAEKLVCWTIDYLDPEAIDKADLAAAVEGMKRRIRPLLESAEAAEKWLEKRWYAETGEQKFPTSHDNEEWQVFQHLRAALVNTEASNARP